MSSWGRSYFSSFILFVAGALTGCGESGNAPVVGPDASSSASGSGGGTSSGSTVDASASSSASSSGSSAGSGSGSSTGSTSSSGSASGSSSGSTSSSSSGGVVDSGPESGPESGTDSGGPCAAGETCVAAAPSGWTGPVEFVDVPYGAPPACPSPTTAVKQGGGTVQPPAQCTQCDCTGPTGGSCPSGELKLYPPVLPLRQCNALECADLMITSSCTQVPAGCMASYASAWPGAGQGGTCAPSTTAPATKAVFLDGAEVCAAGSTLPSCGPAAVCAAQPSSPFRLCITQTGDASGSTCPAPYVATPQPQVFYTSIVDGYTCTPCVCEAAVGCSGGKIAISPHADCSGATDLPLDMSCAQAAAAGTWMSAKLTQAPTPDGYCAIVAGGQLQGSASATDPFSVCCMP